MKVVIFCGGLGTRLREETEFKPKPMVNIGTKPILWHIMKYYSSFGFNKFVLCLGYKGEMIKEFFYNYELFNSDLLIKLGKSKEITFLQNNSENDWEVTLVNTGDKALKGARLKKIEKYIDSDTIMLTYGDGLCDVNIADLLEFHKSHGKLVTVTGVSPVSRFGELHIEDNKVTSFCEKPKNATNYINGGYFVLNKKVFDYLSSDNSCDFEIGVLEKIATDGNLMVYKHSGNWACMDTIRDMDYLNNLWEENKAFWKIW